MPRVGPRALAMAATLAIPGAAVAQAGKAPQAQPSGGRWQGVPVGLTSISNLHVGPHGVIHGPAPVYGGVTDSCNATASHTDANFAGGNFVVQAGFAQTEMAAASYTVAASEFPVRINMTEVILATSNASQQTTTQWSMLFYSGTPSTGTLVASYSSDDVVLPHARVGPGTAGTNIQFSIDPSDPEQIIIPDNGSHTFSVAFRIDHHNQQSGSGCGSNDVPTCCNAFPCTDYCPSYPNCTPTVPSGNWLYGVNCGSFGCPPNGGWASFSGLSVFCRPSGDWVLRAVWSGVGCTPGVGACCLTDGTCQQMAATNCTGGGGTYRGDGVDCANANCPQPTGACCSASGGCVLRTQASCASLNGTWLGGGTACNGTACPTGACCFADGTCQGPMTSLACTGAGGTYHGTGSTCANANCPQPTGACCVTGGGCDLLTQADCNAFGGTWRGAGSACSVCSQPACYANCDTSTSPPILNVADFTCFLQKFASADAYANCDASTTPPVLNVADFTCFLQRFAQGCP